MASSPSACFYPAAAPGLCRTQMRVFFPQTQLWFLGFGSHAPLGTAAAGLGSHPRPDFGPRGGLVAAAKCQEAAGREERAWGRAGLRGIKHPNPCQKCRRLPAGAVTAR